ncbi:hypothetical protein SAMN05444166_2326 [Singulisphaera sp. GP187]|uniref:hypothetical protein n=1 Tax=Singulisphaera sp. GP187 TaxID=1882752 RepID=UPI00092C34EE|nr:hypothetical protein [Singulisphaera sp. GP187]SIO07638.1 hypothetical protein SAMN05444166_2326 [Singulisphaera sp. GP187]
MITLLDRVKCFARTYAVLLGCVFVATSIALLFALRNHERSRQQSLSFKTPDTIVRIRERPLQAIVYPFAFSRSITPAALERAMNVARPRFKLKRLPVPLVLHALRLWGSNTKCQVLTVDSNKPSWTDGPKLADILLNDKSFVGNSSYVMQHYLERSRWGIQVATDAELRESGARAASHVGKFHDTMARIGMSSSTRLYLHDGTTATLGDAIVDEAVRYHVDGEIEWSSQALFSYVSSSRWVDRYGQVVDKERIVLNLLDKDLGTGSCHGMHVPMALATALNIHGQMPFLSSSTVNLVRSRLQSYARLLESSQDNDGSWKPLWYAKNSSTDHGGVYKHPLVRQLDVVGHHMEWLIICPPELRPHDHVLNRSVMFIINRMPEIDDTVLNDWHHYLPISHAARVLRVAFIDVMCKSGTDLVKLDASLLGSAKE